MVELEVLDHREEQQEEDDERRELAAVIDALKRICMGHNSERLMKCSYSHNCYDHRQGGIPDGMQCWWESCMT